MKYYGTKNNKDYGFYEKAFENAIEITDEYWIELLEKQNNGKIIIPFEGNVIAVNSTEYEYKNQNWIKLSENDIQTKQLSLLNAVRAKEICKELENLDAKRIRALAEPSLKDENTTWLEFYNQQIFKLRDELSKIS